MLRHVLCLSSTARITDASTEEPAVSTAASVTAAGADLTRATVHIVNNVSSTGRHDTDNVRASAYNDALPNGSLRSGPA
jgi:hypothetical protein